MIRVISFDAAHTLMDVKWHPGRFAWESACAFGLNVDESAISGYDRMLRSRWGHYQEINLTRDHDAGDAFWDDLTRDWLVELGMDTTRAGDLAQFGRERMYGEDGCFTAYPETLDALDHLRSLGYQLIVLSNWDYSLERTLIRLGIRDPFDHVFASLEWGVEKPDPQLFRIVEKQVGFAAHEVLHVGDNPLDDLQGALGAGWRGVLLDRSLAKPSRPRIPTLLHVPEALAWTD